MNKFLKHFLAILFSAIIASLILKNLLSGQLSDFLDFLATGLIWVTVLISTFYIMAAKDGAQELTKSPFLYMCTIVFSFWAFGSLLYQPDSCDKVEAYSYSKEFVEKRLKYPPSAEFASFGRATVTEEANCTFQISSHVDATNAFGGMIRNSFSITVRDDGDRWRLVNGPTFF